MWPKEKMNFKKIFTVTAASAAAVMLLASCSGKKENDLKDVKWPQKLDKVTYMEGEPFENAFYKTILKDDEVFFEVCTSEGDTLELPVNQTVIYSSEEGEDSFVDKSTMSVDGNEIIQYQIVTKLESENEIIVPATGDSNAPNMP